METLNLPIETVTFLCTPNQFDDEYSFHKMFPYVYLEFFFAKKIQRIISFFVLAGRHYKSVTEIIIIPKPVSTQK